MLTMMLKVLSKCDFYYLKRDHQCYLLHIPTMTVVNLKEDTVVDQFFVQLTGQGRFFDDEEFQSLEEEVLEVFPVFSQSFESKGDDDSYSMQDVILPISGKCNLRCTYCFAQNKGDFGFGDITPENCHEIIDYIMAHADKDMQCRLNFFGGEPMLRMDTIDAVLNYISEKYADRNVGYGITTNGTLFTDENIEYFKNHHIDILYSYDGPEEFTTHRVFPNGKRSNDLVLKNILKVKAAGVKFQMRATIPSDCECMWKVYDYFENLGMPFSAVPAYKSRNVNRACVYDERLESFKKQYEELIEYYIRRIDNGLPVHCMSIREQIDTLDNHRTHLRACSSGKYMFSIVDSGEIFSCEHLAYDKKYAIGDIRNGIDVEKMKAYRPDSVHKIESCRDCWAKYLCSGGCYSEKLLVGRQHDALPPDECEMQKMRWNFLLSVYVYLKTRQREKKMKSQS